MSVITSLVAADIFHGDRKIELYCKYRVYEKTEDLWHMIISMVNYCPHHLQLDQ
jgi:hypothetical protein